MTGGDGSSGDSSSTSLSSDASIARLMSSSSCACSCMAACSSAYCTGGWLVRLLLRRDWQQTSGREADERGQRSMCYSAGSSSTHPSLIVQMCCTDHVVCMCAAAGRDWSMLSQRRARGGEARGDKKEVNSDVSRLSPAWPEAGLVGQAGWLEQKLLSRNVGAEWFHALFCLFFARFTHFMVRPKVFPVKFDVFCRN
ncbi:MAG: hypothetical protein JWP34_5134 [Massilia sp.]|nr:hypothetical protein [Massilia sp.]